MELKAINFCNYAGSGSIGVMQAGFKIDRILEISDEMVDEGAAQHFKYNYPDIPVIKPSVWDDESYLANLRNENFDMMYGWPPCSGLSSINQHASADNKMNCHLYKYADNVLAIRPKTFFLENAPTLVSRGKPVLNYIVETVSKEYYVCVLRDLAYNHNVPMKRMRTMVVGFRKDVFPYIPTIDFTQSHTTTVEVLSKPLDGLSNLDIPKECNKYMPLQEFFGMLIDNETVIRGLVRNYDEVKDRIPEEFKKPVETLIEYRKRGTHTFDKSLMRAGKVTAPSLTSLSKYIHPIENRPMYVREYARLMGYPDTYIFKEDVKVPYAQAIAQGVPAPFTNWISTNLKTILNKRYSNTLEPMNQEGCEDVQEIPIMYVSATGKKPIYRSFISIEDFKEASL